MPNLLILTVGTGTAGKYSDLLSGLRTTVEKLAPRQFWLVPSTFPDSLAIAKLLAENTPGCQGLFSLEHPDDLESCRQHIRNVIVTARSALQPGERLLVNPTSGTKQMTAAATLAALDELVGDIVFTTGDRADGVVITGTERITAFEPAAFFRERDLKLAQEFFEAGDFYAAERVLKPHNHVLASQWATAFTCHHWRRFDYDKAKCYDQGLGLGNRTSFDILADIFAWADHAIRHGDPDEGMRLTYKALERAARFALEEKTGIRPNEAGRYAVQSLVALNTTLLLEGRGEQVALGLQELIRVLRDMGHALGLGFDSALYGLAIIRNEATHLIRPVEAREAQAFHDRALNLIRSAWPTFQPTIIPSTL